MVDQGSIQLYNRRNQKGTMKILVCMSDNRRLRGDLDTADYNSLAAAINAAYCKAQGYDFRYYRPYLNDRAEEPLYNCMDAKGRLRHASWSKLLSMQRAVAVAVPGGYEYVVYIDSDCIFKDWSHRIEDMIKPGYDILVATDAPFHPEMPCAGFFILKVGSPALKFTASKRPSTEKAGSPALRFLKDWYGVDMPRRNKGRYWEQSALWSFFKSRPELALIDNCNFFKEGGPDQCLRHIASFQKGLRIPYFRDFLAAKGVDFAAVVRGISTIEFSTVSGSVRSSGTRKLSVRRLTKTKKSRQTLRWTLQRSERG